ncbi:hypothetical protein CYMTET_23879 [Cymbomonas tetramitiformis]|uniref:Uncharacterized protein n=1 Tax=Cymbomonas tetramitiformis TaxID=36881 RepID=A0AAE0FYE9_9CHLO|nr:hypothetical protein CYMTET_23879 [Cymbomonas tetramitiformis]
MKREVDVLISTQANAFQVVARGVKKPVMWLTDGQSARFNLKVIEYAEDNELVEFVYPPHTTTAHSPLDRIFHQWHTTYSKSVEAWCKANPGKTVTKAVFAAVFPEAWDKWTRNIRVPRVAAKVGITENGIFPENIADSFFVKSNLQQEVAHAARVKEERSILPPITPQEGTFSTRTQKLEEENRLLREELHRLRACPLSPEEIGLCTIKSESQIPSVGTSRKKVTQVWGSVPATGLRRTLREGEAAEANRQYMLEQQEMFNACARELERLEEEANAPLREAEQAEREAERLRRMAEKEAEKVRKEAEKAERELERSRVLEAKRAERIRRDAEKVAKAAERENKKREREAAAQQKKSEAEARKQARVEGLANRAQQQQNPAAGSALADISNQV